MSICAVDNPFIYEKCSDFSSLTCYHKNNLCKLNTFSLQYTCKETMSLHLHVTRSIYRVYVAPTVSKLSTGHLKLNGGAGSMWVVLYEVLSGQFFALVLLLPLQSLLASF